MKSFKEFQEEYIDELSLTNMIMRKISTVTKSREIQKAIVRYVELSGLDPKSGSGRGSFNNLSLSALAAKAAREFDLDGRVLIKAIDAAIKRGIVPDTLKAHYEPEGEEDL